MLILITIFWISLFLLFYAYIGYPITLWILSIFIHKPVLRDEITPSISLVISVYNEEGIIEKKLINSLELDYPKDLLKIVVISDGSTDRTNEIINNLSSKDKRIKSCILEKNMGKAEGLNQCVPQVKSEIVLFSDANSLYPKDLVKKIIRPFADEKVGLVTGWTKYFSLYDGEEIRAVSFYNRLEKITKALESRIGSCVGADGAVFAIRKDLYKPLNKEDINDLVIPFKIIEQKKRCVLESRVFCREETAGDLKGEQVRQVRITNRTIRAIFKNIHLLNFLRFGLFSLQLISHKLMKILGPFFLILLFLTNCIIAFRSSFYVVLLSIQIAFYLSAFLGLELNKPLPRLIWKPLNRGNKLDRLLSLPYSFVLVNLSYLKGWTTYISGEKYTKWEPERLTN